MLSPPILNVFNELALGARSHQHSVPNISSRSKSEENIENDDVLEQLSDAEVLLSRAEDEDLVDEEGSSLGSELLFECAGDWLATGSFVSS